MLLDAERQKNNELSQEVTKYSTMLQEKNELISSIRAESEKYKSNFENLNNQILMKLTALMNKPGSNSQNIEEINRVLSSVHKIDRDISQLKRNNQEIKNRYNDNLMSLHHKLDKNKNEIKNSMKTEHVTKTIIKPFPVQERIVRAAPIRRVIAPPVKSTIQYHTKCTCNCNGSNMERKSYTLEKCPLCNVGMINKMNQVNSIRERSPIIQTKVFTEPVKTASFSRKLSTEPVRHSAFMNKHYIDNSILTREEPVKFSRNSMRYSAEPNRRVAHQIRKYPKGRVSVKEHNPYLFEESVKERRKVKNVEVRRSITRT